MVNDPEDYVAGQGAVYDIRVASAPTDSDGTIKFSNQQGLLKLNDPTIHMTGNVNVGDQFT